VIARTRLLAYAAPALPLAMMGLPLNVYLQAFWSGGMGLRLGLVGLVLTAVRFLDIVVDPWIGRTSDRLRGRFGRRKPFIAAALPVGVLGGWLLFAPAPGSGVVVLFAGYAGLTIAWSLISLPWQAWGAEMSPDYAERVRIAGWRETGTLLGVVASAILPVALSISDPGQALRAIGLTSFALAAPTIAVLLWRVPESGQASDAARAGIWAAIRTAAANRPFRLLLGAWTVNGISNGMPMALFLFICAQVLQAPEAVGPVLLVYFAMGILGVPAWGWVARRFGKHRAWAAAMAMSAIGFLPVLLLGPGDVPMFLAICVVTGFGLGADLALPPAMQADVIDLDELTAGENRAGLFFAAWTMAQKAGYAVGGFIGLGVLDLAGFRAAGPNGRTQIVALLVLYCLVPVLLKLGAVAMMWFYPLDAREQLRIRAALGR
jgi:Na+/melibiose symporter-like transporter